MVPWSPGNRERLGHPGDDEVAKWLGEELADLRVTFFRTETVADLISVLAACSNLIACGGGHCHLAASLQVPVSVCTAMPRCWSGVRGEAGIG